MKPGGRTGSAGWAVQNLHWAPRPAWGLAPALALGIAAALAAAAAGCAGPRARADAVARAAGFTREEVVAGAFVLTAFSRIHRPDAPLDVYIEGDGVAWRSRTQPSADPTPRRATALALAAADPAPNVLYLARPCQFTPRPHDPRCTAAYWTGRRFAPEVVAATDIALSRYAARVPGQGIHLVGFSGGGALAVLVAARRGDIASLRTVAGDLDTEFVNRLHGVSPMPESLNPIEAAARIAGIAQVHFAGTADSVVPPIVAERFIAATGGGCAQLHMVAGLTHTGEWDRLWPALLGLRPMCADAP